MLDPRLGGVQVQAAVLDVLVDLLGRLQEGVLHVFTPGGEKKKERVRRGELPGGVWECEWGG